MVNEILEAVNIPFRETRFPDPPASAYVIFMESRTVDTADRVPVVSGNRLPGVETCDVTIELYAPTRDRGTETAIEEQLLAHGLSWTKQEAYWLEKIQRYQTIYEFTYYEKGGMT